jgi:hypothetical protein
MQYKIVSATPAGEYQTQYGMMKKYAVSFEGGESAELSQKPETPAPVVGSMIEGEITTTQYGNKFRKARAFSGPTGNGHNDPNTRKEIIRQNSLTNAVNYCIAKAKLTKDIKYLTGKEVVQVATYFAKYSLGDITVVTEAEKPAEGKTGSSETVTADDEDVDIEDIYDELNPKEE